MYKLLIFDWDGTIIDSTGRIVSSMQAAARDLSFGELASVEVQNIIGLGLPEAIKILIPAISDADIERLRERYIYYYLGCDKTSTPLFAGVENTLQLLRNEGYRMAITGKGRCSLDHVLSQTGLASFFEISRCADETLSKPNPLMLEEILAATNVQISEALMIGDTEYDLEMANHIGMDTAAVTYGAHSLDRLLKYNPATVINHFFELHNWLQQ